MKIEVKAILHMADRNHFLKHNQMLSQVSNIFDLFTFSHTKTKYMIKMKPFHINQEMWKFPQICADLA